MKRSEFLPKLIFATLIASGAMVLGFYAIYRSYTDWKLVYLIEGITPVSLGGWGLATLIRFWIVLFKIDDLDKNNSSE